MAESEQQDVVIVGAGLAGLSCAIALSKAGKAVAILEASDRVGGRVRSDVVDGFTLDHGFQVLLTAYPACKELLDYDSLRLRPFAPGALVRKNGAFAVLADPWRSPSQTFATAFNSVGTWKDKLLVAKLRSAVQSGSLDRLYQNESTTTKEFLAQFGFSEPFVEQFFRPFIGGVYLDESLETSSRMLKFVFRMFSAGDVAVPAEGMGAIPRQLAERLPRGTIRLQSSVTSIDGNRLTLADGSTLAANSIVIATESGTAARLLKQESIATEWNRATTFYYAADSAPDARKMLVLRGDESGIIQTATILSNVAPEYALAGKALVSVSVSGQTEVDIDEADNQIRGQLKSWYGDAVTSWKRLRVYDIPFGVPNRDLEPVMLPIDGRSIGSDANTYLCGDHRETPSIQGAMNSGLRVANAILR